MSAPLASTRPGEEPPPLAFTYRTFEKERRRVLVGVDAIDHTGVWSVYDVPVGRSHTVGWRVQRLDGYDEKLDAASALAAEYPAPWTQFALYSAATGVSLTRVIGQEHFPSDVLVGSSLGWLIGHNVVRHHHKNREIGSSQ